MLILVILHFTSFLLNFSGPKMFFIIIAMASIFYAKPYALKIRLGQKVGFLVTFLMRKPNGISARKRTGSDLKNSTSG